NRWSRWRRSADALGLVMRTHRMQADDTEMWEWIRSPLPPRHEHRDFDILRRSLEMGDEDVTAAGGDWQRLSEPDKSRVRSLFPRFTQQHNPFIRHIVRRSRGYLEGTIDPETKEPYLKPIRVELLG